MKNFMTKFVADEQGATAIEYGLIAALISIVIIVGARATGTKLTTTFTDINGQLGGAASKAVIK